jgi:hypothetical protein
MEEDDDDDVDDDDEQVGLIAVWQCNVSKVTVSCSLMSVVVSHR